MASDRKLSRYYTVLDFDVHFAGDAPDIIVG